MTSLHFGVLRIEVRNILRIEVRNLNQQTVDEPTLNLHPHQEYLAAPEQCPVCCKTGRSERTRKRRWPRNYHEDGTLRQMCCVEDPACRYNSAPLKVLGNCYESRTVQVVEYS